MSLFSKEFVNIFQMISWAHKSNFNIADVIAESSHIFFFIYWITWNVMEFSKIWWIDQKDCNWNLKTACYVSLHERVMQFYTYSQACALDARGVFFAVLYIRTSSSELLWDFISISFDKNYRQIHYYTKYITIVQ